MTRCSGWPPMVAIVLLPRLSLRRPADLVTAVPYLLGFHPDDSLVVVWLGDGCVRLTARIDLCAANLSDLPDSLAQMAIQCGADSVVLLAFGQPMLADEVLAEAADAVPDWVEVLDELRVTDGRWRSRRCQDPTCCPPEGTVVEEASAVAVTAVAAGLQALPSRQVLLDSVQGPTGEAAYASVVAQGEAIATLAELGEDDLAVEALRRVRSLLQAEPLEVSQQSAVELAVLVAAVTTRDAVLKTVRRETAQRHVALWSQVVTQIDGPYALAPLAILAVAGWQSGNGALLSACLARGLAIDEEYSLWELLEDIVCQAMPPARWQDVVDRVA